MDAFGDLSMYIMLIVAMGLGVIFTTRKFTSKSQNKDYNYRPKTDLDTEESSLKERINFRKKPLAQPQGEKKLSFRQSNTRALKNAQSISNFELNSTFWWSLAGLCAVVLAIAIY